MNRETLAGMRQSGICPKCSNNELFHIGSVADTGDLESRIHDMYLAVVFVGHGFFGDEKRQRVGKLSAVVCRDCGFTELYVVDPQSLYPDGRYVSEINGPGPGAPYR